MRETSFIACMPLLIYDDKCYLCTKFAFTAKKLARGRINLVGHYSEEGIIIKKKIFPPGFDPTTMFWLVKNDQVFGGRSGLFPLAIEIMKNMFKPSSVDNISDINMICSNEELSCTNPADFVKRVSMLMKNGKKIYIEN